MSTTLYWHDYETFGRNPRWCGIAQFAGIRTDENLKEIGEPLMLYCQPPQDSWPEPEACLITGITPQLCRERGVADVQFAKKVLHELARPGTCGVGFNNIRFDDEFTRQLLYRNFYDPYEREWKNGNSRWDLLDVLRMARALRPEGIEWPFDEQGNPVMKLEALTAANHIEHAGAHDALVDVRATIAMARKLKQAQPRLYDFAFQLRDKNVVKKYLDLETHHPVLHTSSKLGRERLFTTLVMPVMQHPSNTNGVIVFDLMQDPAALIDLPTEEIRRRLFTANTDLEAGVERLAVKTVHRNKSPMVAPLSLFDGAVETRLGLDRALCEKHWQTLYARLPEVQAKLKTVFEQEYEPVVRDAEFLIYGGFLGAQDKRVADAVRKANQKELSGNSFVFSDQRLSELLFRYRARNFPQSLSADEQAQWQEWRHFRLHNKVSEDWLTREAFRTQLEKLKNDYQQDVQKMAVISALMAWESEVN